LIRRLYWSSILVLLVVGLVVESYFVDPAKVPQTKRGKP
jgi:hypothetical protein